MRTRFSGLTLIELIISVAILAILIAIAAPSFSAMVRDNRLSTETNDLNADLGFARSEASRRGVRVTVCASDSGTNCTNSAWTTGRIVFVDGGTAGTLGVGDVLLRVSTALANDSALTARDSDNAALRFIQFRPRGLTNQLGNVTFTVCDDRSGPVGRQITVNATGRAALTKNISCP